MSKRSNKVNQKKLKNDGKAIAQLEEAIHKAKRGNSAASAQKSRVNQKSPEMEIVGLLGSREEQEIAWLEAILDPEAYAARIPITQVTGAVPVNLYRKTLYQWPQGNASGFAFAGTFAEGWDSSATTYLYLRSNSGAGTSVGTFTGATYVGSSAPASYVVLPTGAGAISLGDVDSDFVQDGQAGTEYVMVGCKLNINAYSTSTGGADEHYVGRAAIVRTLDSDRYPIAGNALSALKAQADEEDSSVQVVEYLINPNGTFTPVEGEAVELGSISATAIPVTKDAYTWRRIGLDTFASSSNTSPMYDIGVFFEGVASSKFEVRWTGLWQVERYPTHLVTPSMAPLSVLEGAISSFAKPYVGHSGYPARPSTSRPAYSPIANSGLGYGTYGRKDRARHPTQFLRVDAHVSHSRPQVVDEPGPGSSVITKSVPRTTKARRRAATHAGHYADAPRSVSKMLPHLGRHLGQPIHPGVPPLAVLASASEEPGFWSQLASAGPAALSGILCDKKLAKIAASHGPAAIEAAESEGGFSLSKLLSGAWDVAKTVGPAILGMLV